MNHRLNFISSGGSDALTRRPFYHPKPTYETFPKRKPFTSSSIPDRKTVLEFGFNYALEHLGLSPKELNLTFVFTDPANVTHLYFKHLINGIEVNNHHAGVHIKHLSVIAFSSSFGSPTRWSKRDSIPTVNPAIAVISEQMAIRKAVQEFNVPARDYLIKRKYIELPDGTLVYTYVIQLKDRKNWLQVHVDALNGKLIYSDTFDTRTRTNCSRRGFHIFSHL